MAISLPQPGRGAAINPLGRFERLAFEVDGDHLDALPEDERLSPRTQFFVDSSKSIIVRNDSPDIAFDSSLNLYRGCEHGCSYCYARPFHEYLDLSSGIDFETKIFVKPDAPRLLRAELSKPRYEPVTLAMSGVTDTYQPIERQLRLARQCIKVLAEFRHPVGIVTKNHLVTRDIDLFRELNQYGAVRVDVSVTTLDASVARKMEPRASSPQRRLDAIEELASNGIPVGVLTCPLIPGLTDHEMPDILREASRRGARWAHMIPLRLPGTVKDVFLDWLQREFPDRYDKVVNRVRDMRDGKLNDARWGHRFSGSGKFHDQLVSLYEVHRTRLGLASRGPKLEMRHFRVPGRAVQLGLFA
jgi:DNA repair photolyase